MKSLTMALIASENTNIYIKKHSWCWQFLLYNYYLHSSPMNDHNLLSLDLNMAFVNLSPPPGRAIPAAVVLLLLLLHYDECSSKAKEGLGHQF